MKKGNERGKNGGDNDWWTCDQITGLGFTLRVEVNDQKDEGTCTELSWDLVQSNHLRFLRKPGILRFLL